MKKPAILQNNFIKQNWFGLLTIMFMIIILISSVFLTSDIHEVFRIVTTLDIKWTALVFLSIFVFWLIDGIILKILTNIIYEDYKLNLAFSVAMTGLFYSALTPFAGGGQPVQIYQMSKNDVKAGDASSIIAMKSIIYQVVMTIYGISAGIISFVFFMEKIKYFKPMFIFGIITNVLFVAFIVFACLSNKLVVKFINFIIIILFKIKLVKNIEETKEKTNEQITIFHNGIKYIKKEKMTIFISVLLTILELLCYTSIPYFIYRSFGLTDIQLIKIFSASSLILMITSFFPLPGGSGAVEGSFYLFFSILLPKNIFIPMLLIWRFITYYLCIIVGGLLQVISILRKKQKTVIDIPEYILYNNICI